MFYKVVLNGQSHGQDVKNILYYRTGVGIDVNGITLGGAPDLATQLKAQLVPSWLAVHTTQYKLEDLEVYPINDAFQLVYQVPHTEPVNQLGTIDTGAKHPSLTAIIAFVLEPTTIENGIKPPHRGYLAVGTLLDTSLTAGGAFKVLADKLAQDIESIVPPVIWYPCRMKAKRNIVDVLTPYESFADVRGAVTRDRVSWRRSRQPEI
jgi:hypothetical protein